MIWVNPIVGRQFILLDVILDFIGMQQAIFGDSTRASSRIYHTF